MYVMGIDAGGTKTHCIISDEKENILGESIAGAAQHQVYGIEQTKENLRLAADAALSQAGLEKSDISYAVLGMSGADGEEDFALLIPAVKEVFGEIPYEIVHDAWIGLYSAPGISYGVVSICGTGAGYAGINKNGEKLQLRNLDYIRGYCGGGGDLAKQALHYAFRSEEGTWEKSLLEELVPPVFGLRTMEEVCRFLNCYDLPPEQKRELPIIVFEAARRGDKVAKKLISDMGYETGHYAAAVIRRLHMEEEEVPVVLIGGLFRVREALLNETFMKVVRETAPKAHSVIPVGAPVMGAVRMALAHRKSKIPQK